MKKLVIENQICSLEQAKVLAKLLEEHAPESLWVYVPGYIDIIPSEYFPVLRETVKCKRSDLYKHAIAVYTGDEIEVLLPPQLPNSKAEYFGFWDGDIFNVSYAFMAYGQFNIEYCRQSQYPVHAKADLLIYLLRQKIIKPEEIIF